LPDWRSGLQPAIFASQSSTRNLCVKGFALPDWRYGLQPAIFASQSSIRNLCVNGFALPDCESKRNQAQLMTAQSKKQSTIYDFQIDDIVSYQGQAVTVVDLLNSTATGFMSAVIRRVDHDGAIEKQVCYSDLLPIGTLFPEKMLPSAIPIHVNQFYFFEDPVDTASETTNVKAGKLISHDVPTQTCTMHYYENTPKTVCQYTPLWISSHGKITRGRISPKNSSPHTVCISTTALCFQSPITSSGVISKLTLNTLRSQGIALKHVDAP